MLVSVLYSNERNFLPPRHWRNKNIWRVLQWESDLVTMFKLTILCSTTISSSHPSSCNISSHHTCTVHLSLIQKSFNESIQKSTRYYDAINDVECLVYKKIAMKVMTFSFPVTIIRHLVKMHSKMEEIVHCPCHSWICIPDLNCIIFMWPSNVMLKSASVGGLSNLPEFLFSVRLLISSLIVCWQCFVSVVIMMRVLLQMLVTIYMM